MLRIAIKGEERQEGAVDRKRVQAERSGQVGQMMPGLHKHRGKVPCGFDNGQGFGNLCGVSVEGRQQRTIQSGLR